MVIQLGPETARLAVLSFGVNSLEYVPNGLKLRQPETACPKVRGIQEEGCVQRCALDELLFDGLFDVGYQLVDAFYFERTNHYGKVQYIIRFVLCHPDFVEVTEASEQARIEFTQALVDFVKDYHWNLKWIYNNPFFQKGEMIEGFRVLSFDFNGLHQASNEGVWNSFWMNLDNELSILEDWE